MELRASDADREGTVEKLRVAAMEGRLTSEELEERVHAAYAARHCVELDRLTADVTPPPVPAPRALPPEGPVFVQSEGSANGFAVASLVCSLLWMGFFGSLLGVVFGHVALRQIKESGGRQGGRGIAIAGLAIGYCSLAFVFLGVLIAALSGF